MAVAPSTLRYQLITYGSAAVWLVNGLYCKVLDQVPRHRQIVGAILGEEYAATLTVLIGLAELIMVGWIVSGYRRPLAVVLQVLVIGVMNALESTLVPELLLWGRWNAVFALGFIVLLYYNEFRWARR